MTWRAERRFQKIARRADLPTLCMSLRMSLNGAADPMRPQDEKDIVDYIRARLNNWQPSVLSIDNRMDEAVRHMCKAALDLHQHYSKEKS